MPDGFFRLRRRVRNSETLHALCLAVALVIALAAIGTLTAFVFYGSLSVILQ